MDALSRGVHACRGRYCRSPGINASSLAQLFFLQSDFVASIPPNNRAVPYFRRNCQPESREPRGDGSWPPRRIFYSSRDTNTANVATIAWKTFRGTWPALLQTTLLSSVRLEIISPRRHSRDDFPLFETARADFCLCHRKERETFALQLIDKMSSGKLKAKSRAY